MIIFYCIPPQKSMIKGTLTWPLEQRKLTSWPWCPSHRYNPIEHAKVSRPADVVVVLSCDSSSSSVLLWMWHCCLTKREEVKVKWVSVSQAAGGWTDAKVEKFWRAREYESFCFRWMTKVGGRLSGPADGWVRSKWPSPALREFWSWQERSYFIL